MKFPVEISWTVKKVLFIEANSEAGALDHAQNEQMEDGEPVPASMECHILTAK